MAPRKVALVTAGSAGLGAAIARLLARDLRYSVIINYSQNAARAEELIQELREGAEPKDGLDEPIYRALKADLHNKADVARLVEDAVAETGGRLDVVVSNFGWTKVTNFSNLDEGLNEEDWDRCYNANVKSHLWLFNAARKYLEDANKREEGSAVFVSTASTAGVKAAGSSLPYATSKAAQIHLVKCLASICAPSIRVNCVSPALLLTDWGLSFPEEKIAAAKENSKLKRLATVEDTAEQVRAFIVSKSITAQNAIVDAGFTL